MADNKLPSVQTFYTESSLYSKFPITNDDRNEIFDLVFTFETIDCYCLECESQSVFTPEDNRPEHKQPHNGNTYIPRGGHEWKVDVDSNSINILKRFYCSRNTNHRMLFNILIDKSNLQKYGQYPAIADTSAHDIKKFKKVLGGEFYSEYNRAIGLYSHGVGVGSFVYLRRLIENFVINPAYQAAKLKDGWDDEAYIKARMKQKVEILKDDLPSFLVQNAGIYSIISKGIHELSEDECTQYFPILKSCIDFVLTELEEKRQVEIQRTELSKKLNKLGK